MDGVHVVVNVTASADGKLSSRERTPIRGGPADRDRVDRLRAAADAVAVGVGTVLADDPDLTLAEEERRVERLRNGRPGDPQRVVVDSTARTPPDARVCDDAAETTVLTTADAPADRRDALADAGVEVVAVDALADGRVDLPAGLAALADAGVERLLVEGGGELVFSLFDAGLVDEFSCFVDSVLVGGRDAPTVADGRGFADEFVDLDLREIDRLDDGVVLHYEP